MWEEKEGLAAAVLALSPATGRVLERRQGRGGRRRGGQGRQRCGAARVTPGRSDAVACCILAGES